MFKQEGVCLLPDNVPRVEYGLVVLLVAVRYGGKVGRDGRAVQLQHGQSRGRIARQRGCVANLPLQRPALLQNALQELIPLLLSFSSSYFLITVYHNSNHAESGPPERQTRRQYTHGPGRYSPPVSTIKQLAYRGVPTQRSLQPGQPESAPSLSGRTGHPPPQPQPQPQSRPRP